MSPTTASDRRRRADPRHQRPHGRWTRRSHGHRASASGPRLPPAVGCPPCAPPTGARCAIAYLSYRGKPHVGGQGVYTRHLTKALVDLGHTSRSSAASRTRCSTSGCRYQAAEPRHLQRPLPRPVPRVLGAEALGGLGGGAQFSDRHVHRAAGVQLPGLVRRSNARRATSTSCTTTSASATALLGIEKLIPTIVTLHHPISKDRELEIAHAPNWRKRVQRRPLVLVREDAGPRGPPHAAHRRGERELHQGHPRRLRRRRSTGMRLVPVGVDPDLFRPLPGIARRPGRLITTASRRRRPEGPRLPAGGDGEAAHRARRTLTIIGKPKRAAAAPTSSTSSACATPSQFVVGRLRRAHRRAVRRGRAGRRAQPVRGLLAARRRGDGHAACASSPPTAGALPEVDRRDGDTVLSCRAGDVDVARRRHPPRPRRRRAARPRRAAGRGGWSSAGAGGAAPSSPSSSTARCWRCRPTRQAGATAGCRRR